MANRKGRIEQLKQARDLAKDVLKECAETKICEGVRLWVFTLLAKIASSARSIEILTHHGQIGDCFVILRTMHDAQMAIEYLHCHAHSDTTLLDIFKIEIAVERYEELKFVAHRMNMSIAEAARANAGAEQILERYEKAKKHPAFDAGSKDWPKRWRKITVDEMYKAVEGKKREFLPKYMMTILGNSFAHSGPIAINAFFDIRNGTPVFHCGAIRFRFYKPTLFRRLATALVLVASETVVEKHFLSDRLKKRVVEMGMLAVPTHFEKSPWRALSRNSGRD